MRCIGTLGFTAIALGLGVAATSAGPLTAGDIAKGMATSHSSTPLMSQMAVMSKSAASKHLHVSNALSGEVSALRASIGTAGLALSSEHIGQPGALALHAGLTSQLGSPIATQQAFALTSQTQGRSAEAETLAVQARNLVDNATAADRNFSVQPK